MVVHPAESERYEVVAPPAAVALRLPRRGWRATSGGKGALPQARLTRVQGIDD